MKSVWPDCENDGGDYLGLRNIAKYQEDSRHRQTMAGKLRLNPLKCKPDCMC